jgi:hypothetical protein
MAYLVNMELSVAHSHGKFPRIAIPVEWHTGSGFPDAVKEKTKLSVVFAKDGHNLPPSSLYRTRRNTPLCERVSG